MEWMHSDFQTQNRDGMYVVSGTIAAPGMGNHATIEINDAGQGPLYVVSVEFSSDVAIELAATTQITTGVAPTDAKAFGGGAALVTLDFRQGHMVAAPAATDQIIPTADGRLDLPIPLRVQTGDFLAFTHTTANTALTTYAVWLFRGGVV